MIGSQLASAEQTPSNRRHTHGQDAAVGKHTLVEQLGHGDSVHDAAAASAGHGVQGAGGTPPQGLEIQQLFARPDQRAPVITSELPRAPGDGGRALPAEVQSKMERAFSADLSDVRVHQGDHVTRMRAQAYAQGANLHFAPGQFDPGSTGGMELIGHEIAHVIQQRSGRAQVPQHKGAVIVDASLEREADDLGHRAARGEIVAAPSASRSLPAGEAGELGIQGNFVTGSSYQVVQFGGVPAYDRATKTPVKLVGKFLCSEQVSGGFVVMSYQDAKEYLVPTADAANPALWGEYVPPKGTSEYLPPVGSQRQHRRVSSKISIKQNYTAKGEVAKKGQAVVGQYDKFEVPAKRGEKGAMERTGFESVKKPNLMASTLKFMDSEADSTGANRELMFQQNETDGMVEEVEHPSLMGGATTTQGATYCAYCLNWFEGPALDADHVMTWKAIGQWFDTVLAKMNDPQRGPTFVKAMRLKFKAQNIDFDQHFTHNPFDPNKPWVASQMGAYYMFNNVNNLALSCKVCNQLEKNDMEWNDHLGKHAFFAQDFLSTLAPGDDEAPVRNDGTYVAQSLRTFNLNDPANRQALDSNRTVFKQSKQRTGRNTRALFADRKHQWNKADALVEKEKALALAVDAIDDEWQSDGEDHASEKHRNIEIGIEDALYFSDKNIEFDPRALLRENEELLDELEDAQALNRQLERRLTRERQRRIESQREATENEAAATRFYDENQELKQQIAQQKQQLEHQQAQMIMMMKQMQQQQAQMMLLMAQSSGQSPQAQQMMPSSMTGGPLQPTPQQSGGLFQPQPGGLFQPQPGGPFQPQMGPQNGPLQPPTWPQTLWPQHQQGGPSKGNFGGF